YGNCYTEFDNFAQGDVVYMSTSSDGGLTWGTPKTMPSKFVAIGGQPVVQPNGTVIVPIEGFSPPRIFSFMSTDGGASWTNPVTATTTNPRPTAASPTRPPASSSAGSSRQVTAALPGVERHRHPGLWTSPGYH